MGEKPREIFEVFFRKKPTLIFLLLKNKNKNLYSSVLAKEVDCTYSHAVKVLQDMEKAKLITFEREGRIKTMKLTETGEKIADHIEKIRALLKV